MIRARAGRLVPRPFLSILVLAALVTACTDAVAPTGRPSSVATGQPSATAAATTPATPTDTAEVTAPPPSQTVDATAAPPACSGSDANRTFFAKAAASMAWPVYCAVLPAGWFVENGTYRLANGGELEISYNGPGEVHLAMVEGNACDQYGSDINACAPRDSVIGQAQMGDRTGELGQLSNAYVLDVDRGANPSWRVTGIGFSEADFRAICAAMLRLGEPG